MSAVSLRLHAKQGVAFRSPATEILYGGAAGGGKALALDTPIPTPSGWTTMGDLRIGDEIFDELGAVCRVVAATEVMRGRPCFRIRFSGGAEMIADAGHQWLTYSCSEMESARRRTDEFRARRRATRPPLGKGIRPDLAARNAAKSHAYLSAPSGSIVTTAQMSETLTSRGRSNHFVRLCGPLELPDAELPIDPYVLGAWLGDGTSSGCGFTTADPEIISEIDRCGYRVSKRGSKYGYGIIGLQRQLRKSGLLGNKHIPQQYLRSSVAQRMALLRGLMDTDGTANKSGACEFDNCNLELITGVHELLTSLGIKATLRRGEARLNGKECGPKYRLKFSTTERVFCLPRKLQRLTGKIRGVQRWRTVEAVVPVDSVPVRCIQVDSPSSLFLAGRDMIPTHNSHLFRVASIAWCYAIPGLQVYLFRREFADLYKNHMEGSGSYPELLAPYIAAGVVKIIWSRNQIRWSNGSVIHLCHCQRETDVTGYLGAEIHVLMIDELTQWTSTMYRYLRARVRLGGTKVPDEYRYVFPRVVCGANPGGVGHNWVKAGWINPEPPMRVWRAAKSDGGMLRQYIPARLEDNPTLTENDPDYDDRLSGLGSADLVRAMREGDWNIVAGGALDDVWSDRVIIPRFRVPKSWRVDRSFDWGSAKPFSVCWWAEADGTEAELSDGRKWSPPRGSLVMVNEWYGASGPNEGLKMPAPDIAAGIVERETMMKGWTPSVRPGPADNSISDVSQPGVPTIADQMRGKGVRWEQSDKSPGSRKIGLDLLRTRLKEAGKDRPEEPGLWIMDHCRNAIAQLPVLPRDPKKPEDVDTHAEDHLYDAVRYRVLGVSRKITVTELRM